MSIRIERRDSARDVAPAAWRALAGSEFLYASYPFALVAESDPLFECRYLLAWDGGRLVAALPTYLARGELRPDYDPRRLLLEDDDPDPAPSLLLGGRGGFATRILVAADLAAGERSALLATLAASVDGLAAEVGADVVTALYCDERSAADALALLGPAASAYWITAGLVIEEGPGGFASYPEGLRSYYRRRAIHRERRRFQAAELDISSSSFDDDAVDAAIPLLAANERKHGGHLEPDWFRNRMAAQRRELGDALRWIACRRDGRLVACLTYTLWEDTVYLQQVGFDYERTGDAAEFFNLTIHLPIAIALEVGARAIDLSTEGWQAKLLRGGRAHARWGVARGIDATRAVEVERSRLEPFQNLMTELGEEVPTKRAGTPAGGKEW